MTRREEMIADLELSERLLAERRADTKGWAEYIARSEAQWKAAFARQASRPMWLNVTNPHTGELLVCRELAEGWTMDDVERLIEKAQARQ